MSSMNNLEYSLTSISPIDGRYRNIVNNKELDLSIYFSEHSLIKTRSKVEILYLIDLLNKLKVSTNEKVLECLYKKWSICDSINVKKVEDITKHDVKALEYYLNIKLDDKKLEDIKKYVHWGLTSQDVNHVSQTYLLKEFTNNLLINKMGEIIYNIRNISNKSISMLSHTHGQPASPTVFEKEMLVFITRLEEHLNGLKNYKWKTKFGGAVGNLNAHKSLIKNINWENFCEDFLYKFDLERHKYTTQIDNYDYLSIYWDIIKRFNLVLIDFCQDMWLYISKDYITQKIIKDEVGSSTMPHKVNPICFENAEGNLGLGNSIIEFFSRKLPISRLQRDLTDSTVSRNYGVALGYCIIAYDNIIKGISRISVNIKKINEDLDNNWIVLAEPIQYALKLEGIKDGYEKLKEFTRKYEKPNKEQIQKFISDLDISNELKIKLLELTPNNYNGMI